ncbi:hypothetical protein KQH82_09220 [bacterium]|nr:hypothetical protein [bacterium]
MKILDAPITVAELRTMAENVFGSMVKAVVDVRREILAVDADMHADLESLLLDDGSDQQDLWGINLHPDLPTQDTVEFDSMINVRPSQGNRSRGVDDPETRQRIVEIVLKWMI